jgi:hypothetical protein
LQNRDHTPDSHAGDCADADEGKDHAKRKVHANATYVWTRARAISRKESTTR